MAKYYLFFPIASICWFTVLCVSAANVVGVQGSNSATTDADPFNGKLKAFYEEMAKIETSLNPFVTLFRDTAKKGIANFEKDKKFIQDAVTKGTEMEKKIQSISDNLQNSNVTLPAELQSELEETEKHAAAELEKLKELEDIKDIEEMHNRYNAKYTEMKDKIEEMSKMVLAEMAEDEAGVKKSKLNSVTSKLLVAQVQTEGKTTTDDDTVKAKVIEFIKTFVPVFFTLNKDIEAVSKKREATTSTLSNIRNDLIKVEQMEYHFLRAHKDLFKTDFASLTRSSMAQFAFAILFGILF